MISLRISRSYHRAKAIPAVNSHLALPLGDLDDVLLADGLPLDEHHGRRDQTVFDQASRQEGGHIAEMIQREDATVRDNRAANIALQM